MKLKLLRTIALVLMVHTGYGQADAKLYSLFYDLPIDSSRKVIYKAIQADSRFSGTVVKANTPSSEITYSGRCSDCMLFNSKPDSVKIGLYYGQALIKDTDKLVPTRILHAKHYFASLDTAKNEYEKLIAYLKPMAIDSTSSGFSSEEGAGEGIFYQLSRDKNKIDDIDISLVYCMGGNFGVFVSYTRSED